MKPDDQIEINILLKNNTPDDDFLGLTPNELHYLLYETYTDNSPVRFRDHIDNDTLDNIPLFRIAEEYLKIIQRDKQIKLTPLGALPKKVMVELYDKRLLLDELIENGITKLWKEGDCISIRSARLAAELSGLVKKAKGKITLTKNGTKFLQAEHRTKLFTTFFQAFTNKFLWSFNDGYPQEPIGQLGWGFSAFMLDKFGDKPRDAKFYADKYLTAFPTMITFFKETYRPPSDQFKSCYTTRVFERFFLWFGLIGIETKVNFHFENSTYIKTNSLNGVFIFDEV